MASLAPQWIVLSENFPALPIETFAYESMAIKKAEFLANQFINCEFKVFELIAKSCYSVVTERIV